MLGQEEKENHICLHHKCVHSLVERVQKEGDHLKMNYKKLFMTVTPCTPVNEPTLAGNLLF